MRHRAWVLIAILLLAFGLRLYHLGAESLWYDETVSVYLAGQSLPALVAHTAGDIHPPGYYILLHTWIRLAGHSDFAVAFPSLFFGVLLVALAYRLAARFFWPEVGLLAAFLVAISPYNLWYSQEVRMYTLAAALGMGVLEAVLSVLATRPGILPSWRHLAAYALCAALGLWVLYYFAFLLVAINLMVGVWWVIHARRQRGRAGGQLGALAGTLAVGPGGRAAALRSLAAGGLAPGYPAARPSLAQLDRCWATSWCRPGRRWAWANRSNRRPRTSGRSCFFWRSCSALACSIAAGKRAGHPGSWPAMSFCRSCSSAWPRSSRPCTTSAMPLPTPRLSTSSWVRDWLLLGGDGDRRCG